jgi:hypothetical protein
VTVARPSLSAWRDAPRQRGRQKYGNKHTEIDGEKFDSGAEAKRWVDLLWLAKAGKLHSLRRQVIYELIPKQARPSGGFERPCSYIADFVYTDEKGKQVVEDVKGASPDVWVIKRKLMLRVHGVEVVEVKA